MTIETPDLATCDLQTLTQYLARLRGSSIHMAEMRFATDKRNTFAVESHFMGNDTAVPRRAVVIALIATLQSVVEYNQDLLIAMDAARNTEA